MKKWVTVLLAVCTVVGFTGCMDFLPGDDRQSGGKGPSSEGVVYQLSQDGESASVIDYTGNATQVAVSSTYENKPVVAIENGAFEGADKMQRIDVPDGVLSIGEKAFENCTSLKEIRFPDSLTSLSNDAFENCTRLTKAIAPFAVVSALPATIDDLQLNAVTEAGICDFMGWHHLTGVELSEGVTEIGNLAFYNCINLQSIRFPNTLEIIGAYAFKGCKKLESITLPESVKNIKKYAFNACSGLKSVVLASAIDTVGEYAFNNCSGLKTLVVPHTIVKMQSRVFRDCYDLVLYCTGESRPEEWSSVWHGGCDFYWYSETEPALKQDGSAYDGRFWRYVDGEITPWVYELPETPEQSVE